MGASAFISALFLCPYRARFCVPQPLMKDKPEARNAPDKANFVLTTLLSLQGEPNMYQKITIVGNVGREPEMRFLPNGTAVTNLSVATNRKWTDKATGQLQEEVTWFRVSVFGKQAETVNQYVTKGRQVLVEGRLNPDAATGGPTSVYPSGWFGRSFV